MKHATVRVSHKPDRAWTPKAYKEREIPIPSNLVESLTVWKSKAKKGCNLVFPTAGCNPKLNFLDDLKAVADHANLDKDNFWAAQVSGEFRDSLSMGWRGSSCGAAVAGAFRHGEHDALSQTSTERSRARKGQSDLRGKEWKIGIWVREASTTLLSLASRIKAIHHAMTAEELANLLKVSRLTILRRAKRGTIPSFRVGSCVRFDPANISRWLVDMGLRECLSLENPRVRK